MLLVEPGFFAVSINLFGGIVKQARVRGPKGPKIQRSESLLLLSDRLGYRLNRNCAPAYFMETWSVILWTSEKDVKTVYA